MSKTTNMFPATFPLIDAALLKTIGGYLPEKEIEFLRTKGVKKIIPKKKTILYSGSKPDALLYIEKGLVRYTFLNSNGVEKFILFIGEGCFVGLEALFNEQAVLYDAVACDNVELIVIDKKAVKELLLRPEISYALLKIVSLAARILGMQIEDLTFRDTEARICRILTCLEGSNPTKNHRITHQTMACLTGAHRVTVTDVIKKLKKEGIIRTEKNGFIAVADFERLRGRAAKMTKSDADSGSEGGCFDKAIFSGA